MKKCIFLVLCVSLGFTSHVAVGAERNNQDKSSEDSGKRKKKRRRRRRRNSLSTPNLAIIASAALQEHNAQSPNLNDNDPLAATWSPQNMNNGLSNQLNTTWSSDPTSRLLRDVSPQARVSRPTLNHVTTPTVRGHRRKLSWLESNSGPALAEVVSAAQAQQRRTVEPEQTLATSSSTTTVSSLSSNTPVGRIALPTLQHVNSPALGESTALFPGTPTPRVPSPTSALTVQIPGDNSHVGKAYDQCQTFDEHDIKNLMDDLSDTFYHLANETDPNSFFGKLGLLINKFGNSLSAFFGSQQHTEIIVLDDNDNHLDLTDIPLSPEERVVVAFDELESGIEQLHKIKDLTPHERRSLRHIKDGLHHAQQLNYLLGTGLSISLLRSAFFQPQHATRFIPLIPGGISAALGALSAGQSIAAGVAGAGSLIFIAYLLKKFVKGVGNWFHGTCKLEKEMAVMKLNKRIEKCEKRCKEKLKEFEGTLIEWCQSFEHMRNATEENMIKLRDEIVKELDMMQTVIKTNEDLEDVVYTEILPKMSKLATLLKLLRDDDKQRYQNQLTLLTGSKKERKAFIAGLKKKVKIDEAAIKRQTKELRKNIKKQGDERRKSAKRRDDSDDENDGGGGVGGGLNLLKP